MAVVVNLIYLIIWAAWVVHQHHIVAVEVFALADAVGLEKLLRRVGTLLVCELRGRHAVCHHEHPIDGAELFHLESLKLLLVHARLALLAEGNAKLAELPLQVAAELAGTVADVCFGHNVGRHYAVLRGKVGNARIGAAIGKRMLEEPTHHLAVNGLFACIDNTLQEEVALLQLVVEEQVALAKDEIFCAELLHGTSSQHIKPREEPAAATALLVGDARVLHLDAEGLVLQSGVFLVDGHLLYAHVADGIAKGFLCGGASIAALQLFEYFWGDACLSVEQRTAARYKSK